MLTDLRNAKMHSNFGMKADSLFSLQSIICAESRRSSGEIIFTAGNHFSLAVHVWWEEEEEEGKIQPYKCVKACVRSPDDNCTRMLPHFQLKKKKKKSPNHVLKAVVPVGRSIISMQVQKSSKCTEWRKQTERRSILYLRGFDFSGHSTSGYILIHFIAKVHWPKIWFSRRE